VEAAVDVGVVGLVEAREDVDDGARFVRGGGVVEVDERFGADVLVERGEIGADVFPAERFDAGRKFEDRKDGGGGGAGR